MGLRSSSLSKKNNESLTWVLHTKNPFVDNGNKQLNKINSLNLEIPDYQEINYNDQKSLVRRRSYKQSEKVLDCKKTEHSYGYGITNLDKFLSRSSIDHPGNIPMVLCASCLLYQTQHDDQYQTEVALPLGMVVNAVFKNTDWLYVQTPHAEEGYVPYKCCLPLSVIPSLMADDKVPCWETQSDVFPRPVGVRKKSMITKDHPKREFESNKARELNGQSYHASTNILLVVRQDFQGSSLNGTLSVSKGDILTLVNDHKEPSGSPSGWFVVKNSQNLKGLVPASFVGYGYL
ncbi:uncharacterized protein LOC126901771 [Daktulosphaira vitifoliae]|uniref:uncharacterized protein LOC126901771 n=1 Tax=Daktulosphaira vitifoliae TaxID=58002 RepID=UPI0021AA2BAE|nr:uncharacterized protein LOC126901771 [Daktulosphaira vitifoliae]